LEARIAADAAHEKLPTFAELPTSVFNEEIDKESQQETVKEAQHDKEARPEMGEEEQHKRKKSDYVAAAERMIKAYNAASQELDNTPLIERADSNPQRRVSDSGWAKAFEPQRSISGQPELHFSKLDLNDFVA
jgi:hypothetical protein